MKSISLSEPIVSVDYLHKHLDAPNLIILDASINKITNGSDVIEPKVRIPNTRFFDIKNKFSDVNAPFPNTMPSEDQFAKEARLLGINEDSAIVIYDDKGIYSSARAWYMLKAMGHHNVAVLDGGLPEWIQSGFEVVDKYVKAFEDGNFFAHYNPNYIRYIEDVKHAIADDRNLVVDARSSSRFKGIDPEPRQGLRGGHIPNSINMPYSDLLQGFKLKDKKDLKTIFSKIWNHDQELVFSCGSGITACILALGAEISGYKDYSVYDGSWTEWGSLVEP